MTSRPELTGHASLFYNEREAKKYNSSSRMIGVQREITERAVELLRLPDANTVCPQLVLDIGCGSGLSGQVLEEQGHVWVGCDVSRDMLNVANERRHNRRHQHKHDNVEQDMELTNNDGDDDDDDDDDDSPSTGDLMHHVSFFCLFVKGDIEYNIEYSTVQCSTCLLITLCLCLFLMLTLTSHHCHVKKKKQDMGTGLPFRPAKFDACISISALQWLCYSNSKAQNPKKRLLRFFGSLYTVLKRGGRAVLQFYPETADQAVLISETATKVGFAGGVVVDYPNSAKAKKHYLVLSFDRSAASRPARGLTNNQGVQEQQQQNQQQQHVTVGSMIDPGMSKKTKPIRKKKGVKTKEWIVHKKETQRKKGKDVRPDTKYTARRRPHKF